MDQNSLPQSLSDCCYQSRPLATPIVTQERAPRPLKARIGLDVTLQEVLHPRVTLVERSRDGDLGRLDVHVLEEDGEGDADEESGAVGEEVADVLQDGQVVLGGLQGEVRGDLTGVCAVKNNTKKMLCATGKKV